MIKNLKFHARWAQAYIVLANSPIAQARKGSRVLPAIEDERKRLARDHGPLVVDCTPGPFDNQTISETNEASRNMGGCSLLYGIGSYLKAQNVIELGTNLGISSAYLASAGGKVVSLDASPCRQKQAGIVHRNLGLQNIELVPGYFDTTLKDALKKMGKVDLAFIDGHHQYQPTLDYFADIRKFGHEKTVYLFDDINWSKGMKQAWSELRSEFSWSGEAFAIGIGIT